MGAHAAGELLAPAVGRFARDLFPVLLERPADAGPAAAAVRVGLVERGDAASADAHEVIDQPRGLLPVGRAQVEREIPVRRLTLRLGAGERKEQIDALVLELLEHGQHARDGGRAHVAEQQEHLVLQHEGHGVLDGRVGLIPVVVRLQGDGAALHAAVLVDVRKIRAGSAKQFDAQPAGRAGERCGHAQHDFGIGHAGPVDGIALRHGVLRNRVRDFQPGKGHQSRQPGAQYGPPRHGWHGDVHAGLSLHRGENGVLGSHDDRVRIFHMAGRITRERPLRACCGFSLSGLIRWRGREALTPALSQKERG